MRMLIVDDDEMTCLGVQKRIREMNLRPIRIVDIAFSAEEALEYARTWTVDILMTDICMGAMTGLDLTSKMKELNPNMRCIILTAYARFDYAQSAISLGCVQSFLLKPASKEEMYEILSKTVQSIVLSQKEVQPAGQAPDPVLWAKNYVQKHLTDEINMAQVANELNLSYNYFSLIFKRQTGMQFSAYVLDVKMKEAGKLMLQGLRTSRVAELLGYSTSQNFSRAFQRYWHCSPHEYRSQHY